MKLVTKMRYMFVGLGVILIHTSVKLVTEDYINALCEQIILIHTSVKLVTYSAPAITTTSKYFNPHEREARDKTNKERLT